MSSTFVADTTDGHKSDNTRIIIVNKDGTVSVDQETLQNLIVNQGENTAVSVVRVGASTLGDDSSQDSNGTCDSQNDGIPHVNLTIDTSILPPAPIPQSSTVEGPNEPMVDPLFDLDPEQLERLECALQSEQAKQILGENVTAMLDILSLEEEKAHLTEAIRMDHCYTNLLPSSAPTNSSTPNRQYGPIESSDSDTSDNGFKQELHRQPVMISSTLAKQPARTRGRGRRPGRPRKDATAVHSLQSSRGGAARGSGHSTMKTTRGGQSVSSGMVMVQQIKHINSPLAPPPSSPSSASLVPLVKPLVMKSDRHSQHITSTLPGTAVNQDTVQKQITPVSGGGSRLVTLTGTKLGQVVAGGQQMQKNRTVPQQQQKLQIQQQQQGHQQEQKQQKQKQQMSTVTVRNYKEHKLPAQQDLDNKTACAHLPGRDESDELDSSEDESEEELVEDYFGSGEGLGRQCGRVGVKNRGSNHRPAKETSIRSFCSWDRDTDRYLGKVDVKGRGERGCGGPGRPEGVERAQHPKAKMPPVLEVMDWSRDRDSLMKSICNERVTVDRLGVSKIEEREHGRVTNLNSEIVTSVFRKRVVKTYMNVSGKSKLTLTKEMEGKVKEVINTKKIPEKTATSPNSEKKTAMKSPVREHSAELPQKPPAVTPPKPASNVTAEVDNRKNQNPKLENRKPSAHIAEAQSPALLSRSNILRRVSTGSEQKTPTSETLLVEAKKCVVNQPASIKEMPEVNQGRPTPASCLAAELQNKQVFGSTKSNQRTTDEADTALQVPESRVLHTEATKPKEQLLADAHLSQHSDGASTVETDNTHINKPMEAQPKKTVTCTSSQKQPETQVKERRKTDENKSSQTKGRSSSSQSSKIDAKEMEDEDDEDSEEEDSEAESSDDESSDSEDDPDRLWCICQKPHNNRFMICCDSCEYWFHGKCVGITKKIGKQMEKKGVEWCCSKCTKKKEIEAKEKEQETKRQSKAVKEKEVMKIAPKETPHKEIQKYNEREIQEGNEREIQKNNEREIQKFNERDIQKDNEREMQRDNEREIQKNNEREIQKNNEREIQKDNERKIQKDNEREIQKNNEREIQKDNEREIQKNNEREIQKDNEREIQKNSKEEHHKSSIEETLTSPVQKQPSSSSGDGVTFCIVCKKEAQSTSIYCSDACILKHAQKFLSLINEEEPAPPVTSPTTAQTERNQTQALALDGQADHQMEQQSGPVSIQSSVGGAPLQKAKAEARVTVFERQTGTLLAGPNAPMTGNLKTWLKDNPTFEVVPPGVMPTTKFYNQEIAAQLKQPQNAKALEMQSQLVSIQPKPSPTQTEPVAIQSEPSSYAMIVMKSQVLPVAPQGQKPATDSARTVIVSQEVAASKPSAEVSHGVEPLAGTPKSVIKSTGNGTDAVHATKSVQGITVSKVTATSTIEENTVNKNQVPVITKKVEVKRSSSASSTETHKEEEGKEKSSGPQPIRINVRKTLQELLLARIQECNDLTVAEEDVKKIVLHIEEEMHSYFKDTGIKYKSKYRSLVFNIKDRKNLTLFRKIADKSVTPHQLVRLPPEALASQELAQWCEREAKRQLEIIENNGLDLTAPSKTHKGEKVIETNESVKTHVTESVDPSAVTALINSVSSTVEDSNLEQHKGETIHKGKGVKDREERREDKDHSSKDVDKSSKRDNGKKDVCDEEHSKKVKEGSRHESHHDNSRSDEHFKDKERSSHESRHDNSRSDEHFKDKERSSHESRHDNSRSDEHFKDKERSSHDNSRSDEHSKDEERNRHESHHDNSRSDEHSKDKEGSRHESYHDNSRSDEHSKDKEGSRHESYDNSRSDEHFKDKERSSHESNHYNSRSDEHSKDKEISRHESYDNSRSDEHFKDKERSSHESHHDNSRSDEYSKDKEESRHENHHDNSRSDEHSKDKEGSRHESYHDNSRSDEHSKDKEGSRHESYDNSRSDEHFKDKERSSHESHHDNSRSDEHSKDKEGSRHESYDNSRSDEHFKDKERSSHESNNYNSRSDEHSKDKERSRHESYDNSRSDEHFKDKERSSHESHHYNSRNDEHSKDKEGSRHESYDNSRSDEHSKDKEGSRHESYDNSRSDEHFKDKERSSHESNNYNSRSDEHSKDKERSRHESYDNSRSDEHFKDKERSSHESNLDNSRSDEHSKDKEGSRHESYDNSRSDEHFKDKERSSHESNLDNSRSDEHSKDKERSRHENHHDNSRSDEHFKDKLRSSHESHHDNSRSDEHSKDKEGSRHESHHDNSRSDEHSKDKEGSRHESHHDNSRSDEHFKDKERNRHESHHDNSRSDEHSKDKEGSRHESYDNSRSDEHFKDKERSSHESNLDNSRSDEHSKDKERSRHENHHDNSRSDEHFKDKERSSHESHHDNSRSDEHFKDKERNSHESHHDNSRSDEHSKDKEGSRHESLHDNSRSDQDSRSKDRRKSSTKNIHHHHHRESSERGEDSSCRKECHDELRKGDIDSKEEDSKQIVKKVKVAVDNSFEEEEEEDDQKKSDVKVENKDKIKVDASSEVRAEDRDTCDREPSSTVIIKNPEVITIDDTSTMGTFDMDRGPRACVNVWKGFVNMPDVAKFFTTVQMVSGNSQNLCKDLPDTVDIVGRIIPETVWDYISKMKKSGTKEILVIRLTVANDEEKIPYIALYMYLNIRNRFGVVGNVSKMINFYIMPLASHNPVPQVLLPLDGPGFEDYRPHLLIGILVRTRRKRLAPQLTYAAKVPKRLPALPVKLEAPERSSTPPLPGTIDDIGSVMPPHPPPNLSAYEGYTTPPQAPKHLSHGENMFHSTDPRLMRKTGHDIGRDTCVSEKRSELLQLENETTVIVPPNTAPKVNYTSVYNNGASCSPGGGVDDEIEILCEYNLHSTPKNSSNLQRKMEEFNNKIEEQKQQFKSINNALVANNAIGGSAGPGVEPLQVSTMMQSSMIKVEDEASKRLSSADVQNEDQNEAYIPTHSFTPNSDSVQWRDRPNDPTPSVPSALSSNLSSSSNLSKILASIKLNNSNSTTGSAKDNRLKEDSIVQNYTSGRSPNDMETMKTKTDCLRYMSQKAEIISPGSTSYLSSSVPIISASTSPFLSGSPRMNHSIPMTNLNSSSSVVPALLSLSTPVIHPVTTKTDLNVNRDSPQKPIDLTKSTTTLRLLSHDDLIKKVMAMELAASTAETQNSMTNPSLQEPYPPEVDHFPVLPMSAAPLPLMLSSAPPPPLSPAKLVLAPLKSLPSGQPLPSGLECEYPTYSSSYSPVPSSPQITVPSHTVQPLVSPSQVIPPPPSPQSVSYSVRHPTPVLYHMPPTHYSPSPPTGYSIASPSHIGSPQGGSHTTSYVSTPVLYSGSISPNDREESEATLRNKRKFQDMEDDISGLEKLESSSSGQGREHWDTKAPVSMRGQFVSCNGMEPADRLSNCVVNSNYAPRTYLRSRGGRNGPPHRTRWVSQNSQDITNSEKKLSHCDASTCSQWDPHVKEFVEKQCERTGELKQKERENGRGRDVQVALGRTVMVQDVGDVDEVIMAVMIRHR